MAQARVDIAALVGRLLPLPASDTGHASQGMPSIKQFWQLYQEHTPHVDRDSAIAPAYPGEAQDPPG